MFSLYSPKGREEYYDNGAHNERGVHLASEGQGVSSFQFERKQLRKLKLSTE